MTEVVQSGSLLCVPYRPFAGDPSKNDTILAHAAILANLFPLPTDAEARKVIVAATLTDPRNVVWEIWRGGAFLGIFLLTDVVPQLDAQAHFVIFDRSLVGKRALCRQMLAWCFERLELRRISVAIPEPLEPLIRFARKLGFRYEGEEGAKAHPMAAVLAERGVNGAERWIAHWGSRAERRHFADGHWVDVIRLRLLREEFLSH